MMPPSTNESRDPDLPRTEKGLPLSSTQLALHRALLEIGDGTLSAIYYGGLLVLADPANPDRFALAAHNFRELLNHLPKHLGFDTAAFTDHLDPKILNLSQLLDRLPVQASDARDDRADDLNAGIHKFLNEARDFFLWYKNLKPRKSEITSRTLRSLDPAAASFPPHLEDRLIKDWRDFNDFFASVAHHNRTPDPDKYGQWLQGLESFLVRRLRPQTFQDLREIDELIRQAESSHGS